MQPDEIYADTRRRVVALAVGLDDDRTGLPVPACPGWTVRDVVAHLAGVAADVAADRLDGAPRAEWTARQVDERAGRSIAELVAEWDTHAPAIEAVVAEHTGMVPLVVDIATHEQDIRGALGEPPVLDSVGFDYGLQGYVLGLDHRLKKKGLPALGLVAGDEEWTVGEGEPAATVATTPLDLFRALSGRRSAEQIRAYRWDGDPEPFIPAFAAFGSLPTAAVIEP